MTSAKVFDVDRVPQKSNLPDPQLKHSVLGADVAIQKVGVNNVECPIKIVSKSGDVVKLRGVFSSYVSLDSGKKGINMSRLPRTIYDHMLKKESEVGVLGMIGITKDLVTRLGTENAYIKVKFDYPVKQNSLLSKDENGNPFWAWAYYPCALEVKQDATGQLKAYLSLTFTYSSACPCSYELSKEAMRTYTSEAISHSQRSHATTTVELDTTKDFWIEDLVELHREALKTEVNYAPVLREDEMHFAVLNGAYPKFVEDAARLMFKALNEANYTDFSVVLQHYESLHAENAIAVIFKGVEGGLS